MTGGGGSSDDPVITYVIPAATFLLSQCFPAYAAPFKKYTIEYIRGAVIEWYVNGVLAKVEEVTGSGTSEFIDDIPVCEKNGDIEVEDANGETAREREVATNVNNSTGETDFHSWKSRYNQPFDESLINYMNPDPDTYVIDFNNNRPLFEVGFSEEMYEVTWYAGTFGSVSDSLVLLDSAQNVDYTSWQNDGSLSEGSHYITLSIKREQNSEPFSLKWEKWVIPEDQHKSAALATAYDMIEVGVPPTFKTELAAQIGYLGAEWRNSLSCYALCFAVIGASWSTDYNAPASVYLRKQEVEVEEFSNYAALGIDMVANNLRCGTSQTLNPNDVGLNKLGTMSLNFFVENFIPIGFFNEFCETTGEMDEAGMVSITGDPNYKQTLTWEHPMDDASVWHWLLFYIEVRPEEYEGQPVKFTLKNSTWGSSHQAAIPAVKFDVELPYNIKSPHEMDDLELEDYGLQNLGNGDYSVNDFTKLENKLKSISTTIIKGDEL